VPKKEQLARDYLIEDHLCGSVPLLERKWYYGIEVEPGVWTESRAFDNVHLTRQALRRIDVRGQRCLDIGCMEGLVSILMARRGASEVVAYDRMNFSERVAFLQDKLGANFRYLHGFPLDQLRPEPSGFDVVVFSGVLYHMLDIIGGLLQARRHVRTGGIMVVETAAILSANPVAHLNASGRFMSGDNYWMPTLGCLDVLLRMCRLKPLDLFYFRQPATEQKYPVMIRVCIPCLAVAEPCRDAGDDWMRYATASRDIGEHLDWAHLSSGPDLPYDGQPHRVWGEHGALDLYRTALAGDETKVADRKREVWLPLHATE